MFDHPEQDDQDLPDDGDDDWPDDDDGWPLYDPQGYDDDQIETHISSEGTDHA